MTHADSIPEETGELSDPEAARSLVEQIIKRRDKIARCYFSRRAALDRFRLVKSDDTFDLDFDDLRGEVFDQGLNGSKMYKYELAAVAEPKKRIARGATVKTRVRFSRELLERIGACGSNEADRGVARLLLPRRNEEHSVQVYLYYEPASAALRIIGVQHG